MWHGIHLIPSFSRYVCVCVYISSSRFLEFLHHHHCQHYYHRFFIGFCKKKILRAINEIMCWIGCIKYMSRTTSKDSIYLCMSMCKKTLSIFGSGSSFFAIACFLFWARFFLRYIARFYSLVPLLTWIWVCVYLFSQYFLSPFFFDFFLFLKRQPAPRTNGE